MSDNPVEPSRRSRREARTESARPSTVRIDDLAIGSDPAEPSPSARSTREERTSTRATQARVGGFIGTWKPLVAAAAALVVAVVVGLLAGVAFDGAAGRSVGSVLASIVVGGTGLGLIARARPAGFLRLRGLDVLWALVLGAVLPFVAGVAAGSVGWPALAALSPRWLLLGVAAPFVVVVLLTVFAIGFVYPAALSYARTLLSANNARVVAAAVAAVAFAVIPIVFAGTVSGMPVALLVGLGIAASVFVGLSGRFWGPVLMGTVFTAVWVALSVAGYVLA
ncbi:hypothetical protein [Microbacterium trichothecenolyticum]|uniref:Uncharacterized protein n=1 Tax=Microbacterium trichothecenolyticum TaxID=69370 RepID=A0ABU0TUL1_MICTR|nr:hypothetical protein [Microbacterium trichothecenolyticum]MDQ1123351.1 hypothetical protein [Microbacterium trichothecenolyticum]